MEGLFFMSFGWTPPNKDANPVRCALGCREKGTPGGSTSWASSDNKLPLWLGDSALLEFSRSTRKGKKGTERKVLTRVPVPVELMNVIVRTDNDPTGKIENKPGDIMDYQSCVITGN